MGLVWEIPALLIANVGRSSKMAVANPTILKWCARKCPPDHDVLSGVEFAE